MIGIYENRVTTFIKTQLNKSNGQTNINKYMLAAYNILQNIIEEQEFDLLRHKKGGKQNTFNQESSYLV